MVHPWADFNDLDTHHYPTYLTGVARFTNGYKVFMPTEFMHAMYDQGGGAGLRDFLGSLVHEPSVCRRLYLGILRRSPQTF